MTALSACIYMYCLPGAHGGQKKASDPWELELQMDISLYVAAGTEFLFSSKAVSVLYCGAIDPALQILF